MRDAAADRLNLLMLEASRMIRGRLNGGRDSVSLLSYPQLATLHYVQESGTPLMKEVAAHLRVSPPAATVLIASLAASGYLRRKADRDDRRAVRLAMTPKGGRALAAAKRVHAKKMRILLSHISPEDRESLEKILERLSKSFRT